MPYRFKSKATGDLIMLDRDGQRLLEIVGKDPGPRGIILPGQAADAVKALEQAIAKADAERGASIDAARAKGEAPPALNDVPLRHRAMPFIDMLRRSADEEVEIVWGA